MNYKDVNYNNMNYEEAINYMQNLTKFGFNFGLERITELMKRLGNPHKKLKVIHVGGTNGKGSTSTMIASILQAKGYKTGVYTSPHLHSYCERYKINGINITEERLAELISLLKPHLEQMVKEGFEHPTEFEVGTAIGFVYFYEENVDFLVLEVGLGGAIDSTNVVTPLVSVITNVAMEHMDYLGNTIKEIATVKSGIIKPGVPVVTAADSAEALEVIREASRKNNSRLIQVGRDIRWEIHDSSLNGERFDLQTGRNKYTDLFIRLLGAHQVVNAATAIAAIETLEEYGYNFDEDVIRKGISEAVWPARLEMVSFTPPVLLDGAHNFHGALTLKRALEEIFLYRKLVLVFGMLGDKEREKVISQLAPLAQAVVITKPNSPRAGEWEKMADEVKKYTDQVYVIPTISEAVEKGLSLIGKEDLLCITGSLYMVAEARAMFIK